MVVAALLGLGAGDLALEVADEGEHAAHEVGHVDGFQLAEGHQVEAGAAAHGAEVDHAGRPFGIVAQEGGAEVLDGVDGGGVHDRLAVGGGHAQVERGGRAAGGGVGVAARHVHAGLEHAVIDGKACNAFHGCSLLYIGNGNVVAVGSQRLLYRPQATRYADRYANKKISARSGARRGARPRSGCAVYRCGCAGEGCARYHRAITVR